MKTKFSLPFAVGLAIALLTPVPVPADTVGARGEVEGAMLPGNVAETVAVAPAAAPAVPLENLVHSIVVTPPTPNTVAFNSSVEITAQYKTNEAGGVRIFFRPMTGSKLTPLYAAHGSPLYPVGSGPPPATSASPEERAR